MANEVGSAYFTLLPSVRGLQGAIAKEVSGVDGTAAGSSIGKRMGGGIAGSLRAAVGPAIAAIGIAKTFNFAKAAVDSFSELEDSSAAASVVFGNSMSAIIAQSKTASTTMGLSEQQVISAANTFGTYGKAAGLSGKELANFATEQTQLAADMASFKGTSPEQAIEAIGSALRGEMEPIRAYGVLLDDASLRQQAMKMGLISTTKDALSPQNKTLAAQALILAQTKDAQGDFARTSESTANIAKTLAAEQENLAAKTGTVLAPAFTAARRTALGGLRGISGFMDGVIGAQKVLASGGTNLEVGKALGITGPALGIFNEGLGAIRAFKSALSDPGGEVTSGGFAGVMEQIGLNIANFMQTVRSFDLGGLFQQIWTAVGPLVSELGNLWLAVSPLGVVFQALAPIIPIIAGQLGSLAGQVGGALLGAVQAVAPVLTQLASVLTDALGTLFIAMAPVIVSLLGQMGVMFAQLAPVIAAIIGQVAGLAGQLIAALMPILMNLVTAVFPMVVEIFGAVMQAIVPLVQMIAGLLIPIIRALLPVVTFIFQTVANVIRSVMQIVMGVIQVVTGIISGNWSQVWRGILNILQGVWNTIVGVVRGALGIVGSVVMAGVSGAANFIRSGFQGAANFLGGVWGNIVNGVSGMIGRVVGFFSGLVGRITGAIGNAGRALWNTGVQIIQGLIDGIGSMMGAIGRAVLSIVPQAIRGPFEDLLGIRSPSRLAIWWGQMLGDGLVIGIDESVPKVAAATARLVPSNPAAAFAVAGTRSAYDVRQAPGLQPMVVEQHIYPAEGMSETNLADLVGRNLVRAGK